MRGLRGSKVSRQGRVTLALRLSDERDDVVHWQDEITRTQRDQIPKKQLAILQHDQFKFAKTELEEQTWSKFVETCDRLHRARWAYLFVLF